MHTWSLVAPPAHQPHPQPSIEPAHLRRRLDGRRRLLRGWPVLPNTAPFTAPTARRHEPATDPTPLDSVGWQR